MTIKFVDNHVEMETPPKRPKRLTGTRFATVMGLNVWQTPFEAWCAITRTWEDPFVENKFTRAGKAIEPKVIQYLNDTYFLDIQSAEDVYGDDYFKKTWGNFFPNVEVFGGMWDGLGDNFVVEIKTTKRAEDWQDGIPEYYKLQSALYAYLLGFDRVIVTASFLVESDYDDPESFVPSVDNTAMFEYSMAEDYPNFEEDYVKPARDFWDNHVMTGISPDFDPKKDKEILDDLRTNKLPDDDSELSDMITKAEELKAEIDEIEDSYKDLKKEYSQMKKNIKAYMKENFDDDTDKVSVDGQAMEWTLSKSIRQSVDKKKLEADGILEDYVKGSEVYTLRQKELTKNED